jgi:hypothetical protein
MSKVFKGLLGTFGLGGAADAPKVSGAAKKDLAEDQDKTKASRAALYATEGGVSGQELEPDQVKKRNTIFGN